MQTGNTSRRDFFKSFSALKIKKQKSIRPPYYKYLDDFFEICIDCKEKMCANVCSQKVITIVDNAPVLNFQNGGCSYCDDCALICELDVLTIENKKNISATTSINIDNCLSWNGVMCYFCKDACSYGAIEFFSLFRASLNEKCINCGFCVKVCPNDCIKVF